MKFTLLILTLLVGQSAFAQTIREQRLRTEMITRVETLEKTIVDTRLLLDDQDVVEACKKINELFVAYPEHLEAIGTHMDLFRGKVSKIKDEALSHLIFFHRQDVTCKRGEDSEYVDPKLLNRELRGVLRSLRNQKKVIKKEDTDMENEFYYEYRF